MVLGGDHTGVGAGTRCPVDEPGGAAVGKGFDTTTSCGSCSPHRLWKWHFGLSSGTSVPGLGAGEAQAAPWLVWKWQNPFPKAQSISRRALAWQHLCVRYLRPRHRQCLINIVTAPPASNALLCKTLSLYRHYRNHLIQFSSIIPEGKKIKKK